MILGLFAAAAVLALAPTRLAVAPLTAAAVLAVGHGEIAALAGVWTAATAAGLPLLGRPPRALAVPLVGAGAVLVAGTATNAALVLPAWVVGTAAAVGAGRRAGDRRWGLAVLAADLPVLAAVGWTVLDAGFASWPPAFPLGAGGLLLAAAAGKALTAAGPDDRAPEAGLLVVRAQAVVAAALALGVAEPGAPGVGTSGALAVGAPGALGVGTPGMPPDELATAAVLAGAAAVAAAGGLALRDGTSDALLELGLVGALLGGSALGWEPSGWAWGALAGGTLNHWLRVRVSAPAGRWARIEGLVVRGGGLGSPVLPVAGALVVGAVGEGGPVAGATTALVVGGLGARAAGAVGRPGRGTVPFYARARAGALAAAVAAGLWAPLLALPEPPGGAPVSWPPSWALAVLLGGAVLGGRFAGHLGPRRAERRRAEPPRVPLPAAVRTAAVPRPVLLAGLGLLAAGAGAVWGLGFVRGFL